MRQPFDHQAKRRLTVLIIFAVALVIFLYSQVSSTALGGDPQKRRRPKSGQPARPSTTQQRGTARDRSRFLHDDNHVKLYNKTDVTAKQIANCDTCHTIRTPTAYEIKDYPDHPMCLRCHETHRKDFFIGARPPICTVCHVKNFSPRNGARVDFPAPSADISSEFKGYFPHGKHQDLIARQRQLFEPQESWQLLRASFTVTSAQEKPKEIENCATCHGSYEGKAEQQMFAKIKWPQTVQLDPKSKLPEGMEFDEKTGLPRGTFKQIPEGWNGHQTCFVCHGSADKPWLSPQPVSDNCAGCHLPVNPAGVRQMALSPEAQNAALRTKPIPAKNDPAPAAGLPLRRIFRFQHEIDKGDHDIGCTACHINVTQEITLSIPRPDVPITSCAVCHLTSSSLRRAGDKITIKSEMEAWLPQKDNKQCIGCHALEIINKTIPCDHYDVIGEARQQPCQP